MTMEDMKERFESAQSEYGYLKNIAEAEAVRWEWCSGDRYDPRPYYYKRNRFGRGRRLKREPENKSGFWHHYGFDEHNRVVVCRVYNTWFDYHGIFEEEFFNCDDRVMESTRWSGPNKLKYFTRQYYEHGRMVLYQVAFWDGRAKEIGSWEEAYEYVGNRLLRIRNSDGSEVMFVYDGIGRVDYILSNQSYILYRRPQKGQTLSYLIGMVKQYLIKEIPRLIANWAVRGPAYCVALMYWPQPWSLFSPMIGVGLESERAAWVRQYPERTKMVLWNPVEFMHNGYVTADSDKDIGDVLDLLDQQIFLTGRHDFGMALFDRIVIELQRFNWSDILDITSDFVVIVTDSDYEMFDSHLAATVPAPLLATLRAKGYFELS